MGVRQREQDHYLKINLLPLGLRKMGIIETPGQLNQNEMPASQVESINQQEFSGLPNASGSILEKTGGKGPDLTLC